MLRNLVRKARRGRGPHNNLMIIVRFAAAVARRAGALLCSLLLLVTIALFPVRARAFAGVLPAVAAGTVVTAFLMASGIYPYEEQAEFVEYVSDNLSALWSQYLEWRTEQSLDPPVTGNELSSLTGYLAQGVVAISRGVWNTLSEFTSWVVNHFSVTDNQTGLELGVRSGGLFTPTVYSSAPSLAEIQSSGTYAGGASSKIYVGVSSQSVPIYMGYIGDTSEADIRFIKLGAVGSFWWGRWGTLYSGSTGNQATYNSNTFYWGRIDYVGDTVPWNPDIPFYSSLQTFMQAVLDGAVSSLSGVTADTTMVSALPALPADTPWGGLAVEGATTAATVGVVEQIIEDGVTEREKPVVRPVAVEVQAGTEVDSETGEVTENPVVVTPADVPVVAENYVLPASITTVFPFSIPWDVMRVFQALNAEPQRIDVTVTLPFPDVALDNEISFQVVFPPDELEENETFQAFMTWFRRVILIVMCVYATWGLASFIKR